MFLIIEDTLPDNTQKRDIYRFDPDIHSLADLPKKWYADHVCLMRVFSTHNPINQPIYFDRASLIKQISTYSPENRDKTHQKTGYSMIVLE